MFRALLKKHPLNIFVNRKYRPSAIVLPIMGKGVIIIHVVIWWSNINLHHCNSFTLFGGVTSYGLFSLRMVKMMLHNFLETAPTVIR